MTSKAARFITQLMAEIAERDARIAELERFKFVYNEWHEKTEWVQSEVSTGIIGASALGLHRADVMTRLVAELRLELAALKAQQPSAGVVDERAAFERHFKSVVSLTVNQLAHARDTDGMPFYEHLPTRIAWSAWQARARLNPCRAQAVPEGYVVVPERMHLDANVIESINYHCGDGQENAGFGSYSDGVLWVGEIEEEDGTKTYGLHIATAEYPEQGSTTLVEFAAAPSAQQKESER